MSLQTLCVATFCAPHSCNLHTYRCAYIFVIDAQMCRPSITDCIQSRHASIALGESDNHSSGCPGPEPGTFGIFEFFQIIKNDFFSFFIKLTTYFCTSPI